MNKRQNAELNAYKTALAHLKEQKSKTSIIPVFEGITLSAETAISAVEEADQRKLTPSKGETTQKNLEQGYLAARTYTVACVIKCYASVVSDEALKEACSFARTQLEDLPMNELLKHSRRILEKARELAVQLTAYGLSAELLDRMERQVNDFSDASTLPRRTKSDRREAGVTVTRTLKEVRRIFKERLDPLMELLRDSESGVYLQYKMNRAIVDAPTRNTQVAGSIGEAPTGKALAGVKVELDGTTLFTETDADGNYALRIPISGAVMIRLSLSGYKEVKKEVRLRKGVTSRLSVLMEKA